MQKKKPNKSPDFLPYCLTLGSKNPRLQAITSTSTWAGCGIRHRRGTQYCSPWNLEHVSLGASWSKNSRAFSRRSNPPASSRWWLSSALIRLSTVVFWVYQYTVFHAVRSPIQLR